MEIVPPTTEIECIKHALAAANEDWEVQVPKEEVWLPLSKFFARHSVPGHGFNEGTDTYTGATSSKAGNLSHAQQQEYP